MLLGDFFILKDISSTEEFINATLELNAAHRVFEGHFPGQPVVPGVCMVQMIKEILENHIEKKTRLIKSDHAKFLAMIDPRVQSTINATIKYNSPTNDEVHIIASLFSDTTIFLKFKGVFTLNSVTP
jgi:3-hydroxyacyl-[acyl-carrier-protein] dehydratase